VPVPSSIQDGRFSVRRPDLKAACSPRARALILNNPWNPVGMAFDPAELEAIVEFAVERDLVLISDEIYEALVYDGRQHVSPVTLKDARQRTVLVNSLSKTYAMTGWRVGYCAGPANLIRGMLLLLQQFSRGPATFVQDAAVCALESSQDCVQEMTAEYQARRDLVIQHLQGMPGIRPLVPDGGLFVMVDLRDCLSQSGGHQFTSDDVRRYLLHEHGVVVIHGSAYGTCGEGFLRVSFAAGGQNLERGLVRLREGLCHVARDQWQEARR
jgi:aspartate/methionine/tyrosine aminotransferase